jgi:hypothetical protein
MRFLSFAGCLLVAALCSCHKGAPKRAGATNSDAPEQLELRYQAAPGVVSPPELAEDLGYLAPIKLNCVGSTASGPTSIQAVVTGDTPQAGAPEQDRRGRRGRRQRGLDDARAARNGAWFRDTALGSVSVTCGVVSARCAQDFVSAALGM